MDEFVYKQNCHPSNASTCIPAELIGSDTARAYGFVAEGNSPVLKLCRMLVDSGFDPDRPLHCYRDDVLCLTVRAIAEAARLEINGEGNGFRPVREPDAASLARQNGHGAA